MIAVIEDDDAIKSAIASALRIAGLEPVVCASRGTLGLELIQTKLPDLAIVGSTLAGISGFDICRELRRIDSTQSIPVILLTPQNNESDMLKAFELGADDCLAKPFSCAILVARVRAILRRCNHLPPCSRLIIDGLALNDSAHSVTLDNSDISLTPTEYGILRHLMSHPGRVYSRSQIIEAVQGDASEVTERSVDVQLVGLRKKLGAWSSHIESVRSIGYRLV